MSAAQMNALDQLLHFLSHAPALFASPLLPTAPAPPLLVRLHLPLPHHNEPIACVRNPEDGRVMVTGTDLLRILQFRFRCLARPLTSQKKFEEGVFSDLRNLKVPDAARLEPARAPLLDTLYRFGCVRTQKRQKVFYWDAVDHERLFRDAWERESRRERDAVAAGTQDPLAPLDDATVETAASWHRTRPLLITYVRSLQDPMERPLNAAEPSALALPEPVEPYAADPEPFLAPPASLMEPLELPVVLPPMEQRLMLELEAFLTPPDALPRLNTMDLPQLPAHSLRSSVSSSPRYSALSSYSCPPPLDSGYVSSRPTLAECFSAHWAQPTPPSRDLAMLLGKRVRDEEDDEQVMKRLRADYF